MCVCARMCVPPHKGIKSLQCIKDIQTKAVRLSTLKVPPEQSIKKCAQKSLQSTTTDVHMPYKQKQAKNRRPFFKNYKDLMFLLLIYVT